MKVNSVGEVNGGCGEHEFVGIFRAVAKPDEAKQKLWFGEKLSRPSIDNEVLCYVGKKHVVKKCYPYVGVFDRDGFCDEKQRRDMWHAKKYVSRYFVTRKSATHHLPLEIRIDSVNGAMVFLPADDCALGCLRCRALLEGGEDFHSRQESVDRQNGAFCGGDSCFPASACLPESFLGAHGGRIVADITGNKNPPVQLQVGFRFIAHRDSPSSISGWKRFHRLTNITVVSENSMSAGHPVCYESPELKIKCQTGYSPREADFFDVATPCEKFDFSSPEGFEWLVPQTWIFIV